MADIMVEIFIHFGCVWPGEKQSPEYNTRQRGAGGASYPVFSVIPPPPPLTKLVLPPAHNIGTNMEKWSAEFLDKLFSLFMYLTDFFFLQ